MLLYFLNNNGLSHDQLYNFYAHTGQWMAPHITDPGTVSILRSPLCFILLAFSPMLPVPGTLK